MNADIFDELTPTLSPNVENRLKYCLANEVKLYSTNVHGKKCRLCPFRTFERFSRLQNHLKYHCEKNMYMADLQSPQLLVIRSYYDYCQSIGPITPINFGNLKLLERTADLIAGWNVTCSSATLNVLKRQNLPILVRVLTHTGPQSKECTGRCIRHSRKLYYTPQFANLFFSLLLTNEARIKKSVNTLFLQFGTTCITPGLLPKD